MLNSDNTVKDKYSAVWVSHSSIRDFLNCPRAYYLNNVYKDPLSRRKISIINPPLSLGQAVHETLEFLSSIPANKRFEKPLLDIFEKNWQNVSGKKGGFFDEKIEQKYKTRGIEMIKTVIKNPGPLKNLAVKINMDLPYFWLSEKDNIILCGKIDWLEYLPETDSVNIIDFKTGKSEENSNSLQLSIYHLLVHNCQKRKVQKASYWYLDSNTFKEVKLPDLETAKNKVLQIAKQIKVARQLDRFICPQKTGCRYCLPYEQILKGQALNVGTDKYKNDLFVIEKKSKNYKQSILH